MPRGVNWRQASGEALLIFAGVLVALAGQAWWEYRGDREAEQHFLSGVLADVLRDSADASLAFIVAQQRLVAADRLLEAVGDPFAGRFIARQGLAPVTEPAIFLATLQEGERLGLTPASAVPLAGSAFSYARLDLSDATFREAVASGRLDTIRDAELRAEISFYYYTGARTSATADERAASQWRRFREVLTDAGLSPSGSASEDDVMAVLLSDRRLVAELHNLRDHALDQVVALGVSRKNAATLITRVRSSLELLSPT